MKLQTNILLFPVVVSALFAAHGCDQSDGHDQRDDESAHSGHEEHNHAKGEPELNTDSHDEHIDDKEDHAEDHDEHDDEHSEDSHAEDGEDGHDGYEEDVVRLSPEQLADAGVLIEPLSGGMLTTHVSLPAEVGLNQDTVVHVTPRVPGIVSVVHGFLGQEVIKSELLAVLESPELGEAKIVYLQAVQSESIAKTEFARQQTISKNT